jgi:hypothetical protein
MAWGAQIVNIINNQFVRSGRGGCAVRFDEATYHILNVNNNNIYNSGRICSFYGNVVRGTNTNNPPTRSIQNDL